MKIYHIPYYIYSEYSELLSYHIAYQKYFQLVEDIIIIIYVNVNVNNDDNNSDNLYTN